MDELKTSVGVGRIFSEDGLMSSFYRFLARFSGRRRGVDMRIETMRSTLFPLISLLALHFLTPSVEGCSSRSTPKLRPPLVPSTPRPNITFHTYACPPEAAAYFCLNGGTCFTVRVGESVLFSCECADGYMGSRCEYKNLDGTYLPSRHRVMLETASIASGATIAVFLVVVICMFLYVRIQRKNKLNLTSGSETSEDLERRPASYTRRDIPLRPLHTLSRERGSGDSISLAVYEVRESPG